MCIREGNCGQLDAASLTKRGLELVRFRAAATSFACHIPRESGEGRLMILNFKRRSIVTVEVKDLGEVNEGWKMKLAAGKST
jgi:hypothetical protein